MEPSAGESVGRRGRAQAELVGVILVFGLMIVGAVVIVALGSSAVTESQDRLSEQRAEKAMTQFDSKAALVALGSSDVQQVSFGADRASNFEVQEGKGWMKITRENQTSGTTTTLVNQSLGAIRYEVNDNTLAYQGGGVWKKTTAVGNRSVMVSPPEFHFRNGTLTLPIMNVTGEPSLGSRASLTHEETVRKYPTGGDVNPLDNHLVKVTVKSDYYIGWGRYFEERTDGEVEYEHDRDIVILTLVTPIELRRLTAATASLSASGDFIISGGTHGDCNSDDYTDSYNSSGTSNDYCDQYTAGNTENNGDVVYGNNIDISTGSGSDEIRGDVRSGGDVTVGTGTGKPYVFGNISYADNCIPSPTACDNRITKSGASVRSISNIETAPPVDRFIERKVVEIESSNDNSGPQISGNQLDFSATTTRTLDSGSYYLENIDMNSDETLELDTTTGPITLAVEEDVYLRGSGSGGATLQIVGDGVVRMYVNGTGVGAGDHLFMEKNSGILNDGDDAEQFRLYGKKDFNASITGGGSNGAKYVGVIYAPPGNSGTGTVTLDTGEVYGGVLTGTTTIVDGSIHFDEALLNTPVISADATVLKITYLHISVNEIRVS